MGISEPKGMCGGCEWWGNLSKCNYLGPVGPCCPQCGGIVEPDRATPGPINMVLHCPACGLQHIDKPFKPVPGDGAEWTNPPHRSHLCAGCGHIWRPADVPTNGVQAVKTKGKADSALPATPTPHASGCLCEVCLNAAEFAVHALRLPGN